MKKLGRNEPCHCGSGLKYKKCCLGSRGPLVAPPPPSETDSDYIQILVETDRGLNVRRIPPAVPLDMRENRGKAAETATHEAAAIWGLPDFVFRASIRRVGKGCRELGDGIVLVGKVGLMIQVKSRKSHGSDTGRELSWLKKNAAKAMRQAVGSIKQLKAAPASLTNMRGRSILVDGNDLDWISVVIIDHPNPPDSIELEVKGDQVVLLRRDWEFLFDQMKSTHSVAAYLKRVAGERTGLGLESSRYFEFALADDKAEPTPLDPRFRLAGIEEMSEPLLPIAPVGHEDQSEQRLFRTVLEDISGIELQSSTEAQRIQALAEMDRLPPGQRRIVGGFFLDGIAEVFAPELDSVHWEFKRVSGGLGITQLAFAICSQQYGDLVGAGFSSWIHLRHYEFCNRLGADENKALTAGFMISPCSKPGRAWDTTLSAVEGVLDLSGRDLQRMIDLWNTEDKVLYRAA